MIRLILNAAHEALSEMRRYYMDGRERSARIFDLQEASWARDSELMSLRIERERLLIDMDRTEASRRDEAWAARNRNTLDHVIERAVAPQSEQELSNVFDRISLKTRDINRLIEHINKGLESALTKDADRATGVGETQAVPEDECPPSCTGSCTCCLRRRRAAGEDIPLIDPSGSKR